MASRVIQTLLGRYGQYDEDRTPAPSLILSSWACLQLESDILAEFTLPSSGIHTIKYTLLTSRHMSVEELATRNGNQGIHKILMYYKLHSSLRRISNQFQEEMYKNPTWTKSDNQVLETLTRH